MRSRIVDNFKLITGIANNEVVDLDGYSNRNYLIGEKVTMREATLILAIRRIESRYRIEGLYN